MLSIDYTAEPWIESSLSEHGRRIFFGAVNNSSKAEEKYAKKKIKMGAE